jgi:hypothetical protein
MQCWQGAIASATNRLWPNHSPLLLRAPRRAGLTIDPRARLGARLFHFLFRRFPAPFANCPLESGFPPLDPRLENLWRFVPGLLARGRQAVQQRVRGRVPAAGADAAATVRDLMAAGAADYLRPERLALGELCDRPRLERFLAAARTTGAVPIALLGRMIALEAAFRAAAGSAGTTGDADVRRPA